MDDLPVDAVEQRSLLALQSNARRHGAGWPRSHPDSGLHAGSHRPSHTKRREPT